MSKGFLIDFSKLSKEKESEATYRPRIKQSIYQKVKGSKGDIGTKEVVLALANYYRTHKCYLNNAYVFNDNFENDFVTVYDSNYIAEIEIKISRSDFSEDISGKPLKHKLLAEGTEWEVIPNKFYYCAPRGLLLSSEVPKYAGLIEAIRDEEGNLTCTITKEAPFIHKNDVYSKVKDRIFRKLAWRYRQMLQGNFELLFEDTDVDTEINFEEVK